MGRQPWMVFGLLKTEAGVSTSVPAGMVLASLVLFTLIYGVLMAPTSICWRNMLRPIRPKSPRTWCQA